MLSRPKLWKRWKIEIFMTGFDFEIRPSSKTSVQPREQVLTYTTSLHLKFKSILFQNSTIQVNIKLFRGAPFSSN